MVVESPRDEFHHLFLNMTIALVNALRQHVWRDVGDKQLDNIKRPMLQRIKKRCPARPVWQTRVQMTRLDQVLFVGNLYFSVLLLL